MRLASGTYASITRLTNITVPEDHPGNRGRSDVVATLSIKWRWDAERGWVTDSYGKSGTIQRRLKDGSLGVVQTRQYVSGAGDFWDLVEAVKPDTTITVTEES